MVPQDVEKQMPRKYHHVLRCRLSKRQRLLYDDFMSLATTRSTIAQGASMRQLATEPTRSLASRQQFQATVNIGDAPNRNVPIQRILPVRVAGKLLMLSNCFL